MPESECNEKYDSFQPEFGPLNQKLQLFMINYNHDTKIYWYTSQNPEIRFLVGWRLFETEILFLEMKSGGPKSKDEQYLLEIAFAFIYEENLELIKNELPFFSNDFYEKLKSGEILNGCAITALRQDEKITGYKIERFQFPRQSIPNTASFGKLR